MFKKLIEICRTLKTTNRDRYYFNNIYGSVITIINRTSFEVTDTWFQSLLTISFDEEVKSKYIPELHKSSRFEREKLDDILNFQQWNKHFINQLRVCEDYIARFKASYRDFHQVLKAEEISITNSSHTFFKQIEELNKQLSVLEKDLTSLKTLLNVKGYEVLSKKNQFNEVLNPIPNIINFKRDNWSEFLSKEPENYHVLRYVFQHLNQVYYELTSLNQMISRFKPKNTFNKIIVGNAGTGKTHISAHLVTKLLENREYILFFKAKQFNGDNVELNKRILELMQVPPGYTLNEILEKLNNHALSKNQRCFFIIDALNETTKSSVGFSNIWKNQLQEFINQFSLFSNLYLICTLRTSYIENIWDNKPSFLEEIKGFEEHNDLNALCKQYFNYYKINVLNIDTADLNVFSVPLLLDLYCKLINESRLTEKEVTLDMNTYLQIFEDYIGKVISEVKRKLNLQKSKLIKEGLERSSEKFFGKNEAEITIDEFSDAFDKDDSITIDNSIARAVLEGYLIFIKDVINRNDEIVKHTQQEIGGFLLAKELSNKFLSIGDLLDDKEVNEKITGNDADKHHQLRLDILKFLIALRPEIITHLKNYDALRLSWWYLYNGFNPEQGEEISKHLLSEGVKNLKLEEILYTSSKHWFNPDSKFNFHFVAKVLERLDLWTFDLSWTFFIYKEEDFFYNFIEEHRNKINETDISYDKVVAKFIAFATATNIRDLRDLATVYLIEFGKKHPLELLELAEYSTKLADDYIYERLISCCYGVALILQNNNDFVETILPDISKRLFQLQFAKDATHPVFNYIVTDSIKHLIEFAIYKKVFSLDEEIGKQLSNYKLSLPLDWKEPSEPQKELINQSHEMSWPEPIGMDFGIYTIPRLVYDSHKNERDAIANVYKRVFELGYKTSDFPEFEDKQFLDFYFGHSIYRKQGKVDRLGKKYSWKGFFDYAGVLLQKGKLKVFEQHSGKEFYDRLSDVDIDVSLPSQDYKLSVRLYEQDLIVNSNNNPDWHTEVKIDSITPLFKNFFDNNEYTMLHGFVEQRINEEYKTRSFLLVETFFIKKNENFEKAKKVSEITFTDWDLDNHFSPDHLRHAYFGEMYWADNIDGEEKNSVYVPTGKKKIIKRGIQIHDVFKNPDYRREDIGGKIEEELDDRLYFESEPTLLEYLWESDSNILKGFGEYFPSIKMGKYLALKSEPERGEILDSNLNECFHCIDYREEFFKNKFNYMRSDLLKKYMSKNNLAILYQVKQHSYDEGYSHNRSMKFYIYE